MYRGQSKVLSGLPMIPHGGEPINLPSILSEPNPILTPADQPTQVTAWSPKGEGEFIQAPSDVTPGHREVARIKQKKKELPKVTSPTVTMKPSKVTVSPKVTAGLLKVTIGCPQVKKESLFKVGSQ